MSKGDMSKEDICITLKSVNSHIELLDKAIELLDINNELLVTNEDIIKNHELRKEAEKEREIYKRVISIMKNMGHTTLCLSTSAKRK